MSDAVAFSLPQFTFALLFDGDVCVDAPPITRWCIGKNRDYLLQYWVRRGARTAIL